MAAWLKITLGLLVAACLIVVGSISLLTMWLGHVSGDLCATTVIRQIPSPDGQHQAVIFQVDCGATTSFNSHVAITRGNWKQADAAELPKSFFVATTRPGHSPAGPEGGPEIRLHWLGNDSLMLAHHSNVHLVRAETTSRGVRIQYGIFP